jgi:DNA-binding response OmpR family regulator
LALNDAVTILVVEDDQLIQALVEEALSDGGFASTLTASGEEAITLLQDGKSKYRAVVTDINLLGRLDGWEVGRSARRNRFDDAHHLHDRHSRGGMGVQGRP